MMKYLRQTLLALLVLLLAAVPVMADPPQVIYSGGQPVIVPPADEMPANMKTYWHVLGVGQTEEEATKDAIGKARFVVQDYMAQQVDAFAWTPATDYVKKRLVKGPTRHEKNFGNELKVGQHPIRSKWYAVPVGVSEKDYQDLLRQNERHMEAQIKAEQHQRAGERMVTLGKLMGLVLAGCVLALAYLRLEEKTKGYLSPWLGVAATGLLALIAAALYLCC